MPLQTFLDSFNVSTGAIGTTTARSGYGFSPKAFIVWTTGRTDAVDAVGGATSQGSSGFGVSATDRRCVGWQDQDAAAAMSANKAHRNDAIVVTLLTSGLLDGLLDVSSVDADGLTFIVDDVFTIGVRVHVLAFGGTDITKTATGQFLSATATGNQAVTTWATGETPSVVFLLSARNSGAPPTIVDDAHISLGYGISSTDRGVLSLFADDTVVTSNTTRYNQGAEVQALINSPTVMDYRADFVSRTANTFTLNWLETTTTQRYINWLAIAGGLWKGGTFTTQTDTTTDIVLSGLGFTPAGALFLSHGSTQSTADAQQDNAMFSVGAATSAASQAAQMYSSEDALPDSEVATAINYANVYLNSSFADTLDGAMAVTAFGSDSITCRMTDADPTARFGVFVACGNAAAGGAEKNFLTLCGVGA